MDAVVVHLSSMLERLDISRLWSMIDKVEKGVPIIVQKNRVMSRGGALLSLMELAKSANTKVASYALDHFFAVHISRGMRTEERELEALITILEHGNASEKIWAVEAMLDLTWNSVENAELIAAADGIPPLVDLVRTGNDVQKESAADVLWHLSATKDICVRIAACGGVPPLVALVLKGNDAQKENAAAALCCLTMSEDNWKLIASSGGIPPLVALVREGTDSQKENAVAALWNLSVSEDNHKLIASSGGIPPLIALLREGNDAQKERAAGSLFNLAFDDNDMKELIVSTGGIPPMVVLLKGGNDAQKINACRALWNLAFKHSSVAAQIVVDGGLDHLFSLLANGSDERKSLAAGTLGFLDHDIHTKTFVAKNGGIAALLKFVEDSNDDSATLEDLVALKRLCKGGVWNSLSVANGPSILSMFAQSSNEKYQELASAILTSLMAGEENS